MLSLIKELFVFQQEADKLAKAVRSKDFSSHDKHLAVKGFLLKLSEIEARINFSFGEDVNLKFLLSHIRTQAAELQSEFKDGGTLTKDYNVEVADDA